MMNYGVEVLIDCLMDSLLMSYSYLIDFIQGSTVNGDGPLERGREMGR